MRSTRRIAEPASFGAAALRQELISRHAASSAPRRRPIGMASAVPDLRGRRFGPAPPLYTQDDLLS